MGATTLRVEDDVKEEFDKLQGRLQADTGDRLSQSQLLRRLLRVGHRHLRELRSDDAEDRGWRPPTPEQIERFFARMEDVPVETDASMVDEVLYGGGGD